MICKMCIFKGADLEPVLFETGLNRMYVHLCLNPKEIKKPCFADTVTVRTRFPHK